MHNLKIFVFISVIFFAACFDKGTDLGASFLNANTLDDSIVYADRIESLGVKALPIFVDVLDVLIKEEYRLDYYGKINICLNSLLDLAKKGIYSNQEGVALLNVIQKQRSINDTLKTADILKIITGVDLGYDKGFVKNYTVNDEKKRLQMINKWKRIINAKSDI